MTPQLPVIQPYAVIEQRKTHVLRSAEGHTGDTLDTLEVQLLDGLAGLLLVAVVDHGSRARGQAGVPSLDLGVGAAVVVVLLDGDLLRLLIGKLLNAGVRHFR